MRGHYQIIIEQYFLYRVKTIGGIRSVNRQFDKNRMLPMLDRLEEIRNERAFDTLRAR